MTAVAEISSSNIFGDTVKTSHTLLDLASHKGFLDGVHGCANCLDNAALEFNGYLRSLIRQHWFSSPQCYLWLL